MKITLTEDQAYATITALEWAINDDFPKNDPINARYQRIIDKIKKQLVKESKNGDNN